MIIISTIIILLCLVSMGFSLQRIGYYTARSEILKGLKEIIAGIEISPPSLAETLAEKISYNKGALDTIKKVLNIFEL